MISSASSENQPVFRGVFDNAPAVLGLSGSTEMIYADGSGEYGYFPNLNGLRTVITWNGRNTSAFTGDQASDPVSVTRNALWISGMSPPDQFARVAPALKTDSQILKVTADFFRDAGTAGIERTTGANALWTSDPEIGLMVKPADCPVTVLSANIDRQPIAGILHSGREHTDQLLPAEFVRTLIALGCKPEEIDAGISPSIRGYYIRTSDEHLLQNRNEWKSNGFLTRVFEKDEYRTYLDLNGFLVWQLLVSGIPQGNIMKYEIDTVDSAENGSGFSHRLSLLRKDPSIDGRFMVAAQIRK